MSTDYKEKKVYEIFEKWDSPLNAAMASAWLGANLKGLNLKILDVSKLSSLSDYYILVSATNSTQAKAMADDISAILKKHGLKSISVEGREEAEWILLDFCEVIVHIFHEASREVFDFDGLWKEAPRIPIPEDYYFAEPEETTDNDKSHRRYF